MRRGRAWNPRTPGLNVVEAVRVVVAALLCPDPPPCPMEEKLHHLGVRAATGAGEANIETGGEGARVERNENEICTRPLQLCP